MPNLFKNKEHLVRMAGIFAGGVVVFLLLQLILVPKGFGVYGHYRAGALADNAARPVAFAGRAACADCHTDTIESQKGSKHATVGCEACHGPLGKHAGDPSAVKPPKHDAKKLCLTCHEANVARPTGFKQVDKQHFEGGVCTTCHSPHAPEKEPAK